MPQLPPNTPPYTPTPEDETALPRRRTAPRWTIIGGLGAAILALVGAVCLLSRQAEPPAAPQQTPELQKPKKAAKKQRPSVVAAQKEEVQDATETPEPAETPQPQPDIPEPEPPPAPQPEQTPDAPAEPEAPQAMDEPAEPEPLPPASTPQQPEPTKDAGAESLPLSTNTAELQKEWLSMLQALAQNGNAASFLSSTEQRLKEAIPTLFTGKTLNYNTYRANATLMQAVELCYAIRHMGAEAFQRLTGSDQKGENEGSREAFLLWATTDKTQPLRRFLQAAKLNSAHPSQMAYSLGMLYELWKRTPPKERSKYLNLAIACSLVHEGIANGPSMLMDKKLKLLTMPELYDYYVEQDSKSRLLADVKKLSVSDLLHVVDTRLSKSEFDWVQKKLSYKRQDWGKAYESVDYIMERATQGTDLYTSYTFAEILKKGGVCRDRGYYAVNTAKCMGIPAVYITGDGERGPHAWIAIMTSNKGWSGTGSYGYNTGRFRNPCSGRAMHESTLLQRDKKMTDDKLESAANLLLLSEYANELGLSKEALGAAQLISANYPLLTAGWVSRLAVLKAQHAKEPLEKSVWQRLHTDLTRNASKNSELLDLAQEVQNDYLLSDASDNTKKNMMKRNSRQIVKVADSGRVDLLLESLERQASIYAEAQDYRGLLSFYKTYYKKYATRGDIFEQLVEQHVSFLSKEDDPKTWLQLAKELDKIYSKKAYSGDYFKVRKDAGVMEMISQIYAKGGEMKKADKISREAQKNLDESARKAERM